MTRVVQTSLVPAPALTLGSPRGRAAPSDFKLLFRSCKKKKSYKKETKVNGFVQVAPFGRQLLHYEQDVFF